MKNVRTLVSANLWGLRLSRGQRDGSLWLYSRISMPYHVEDAGSRSIT
jgi:hypothetical protein